MHDRVDRESFAVFIKENQSQFYRLAYGYVHDPDTALDLVQDAIVKALQKVDGLRHPEYLKTWFYRVLVNECISHLRRNKTAALPLLEDVPADVPEEKPDPEAMRTLVLRLPAELQSVVFLRFYEDMKLSDIALATGTNLNTVKTRLYRALRLLKTEISESEVI